MIVLYGAGTTGRVIARTHKDEVLCFVDSDASKVGQIMEGKEVVALDVAQMIYPEATWIAAAITPRFHSSISAEIGKMGVKTASVWKFLPQRTTPPTKSVFKELIRLVDDSGSINCLWDQWHMRNYPDHYTQSAPSDISSIYFPDFIKHRDDEHFVDCGAADGDTVREFLKRWDKYQFISAFEPDLTNLGTMGTLCADVERLSTYPFAVSDGSEEEASFVSTGDYSAHLGDGKEKVGCVRVDDCGFPMPPTFIKMDIEGSELAALWGARRILKEHKPVLAICAYHESSHLWEIPLLIHALQPQYELFLRRYAAGAFELVWYAVPQERVIR